MTTISRTPRLVAILALTLASCTSKSTAPPPPPVASGEVDTAEERTADTIARLRESAVALEYSAADAPTGARRMASGVVISDDGDVLSVRIDPPSATSPVLARDALGHRLPAQWVAADSQTGLTLLKIPPGRTRPAVSSPKGPRLGGQVLLIGNPFGLGHSVSRGYVSGMNRRVEIGPRQLGGLIQVDAALHPGDSGALLADLHGGWLGLIRSGLAAPDKEKDKEKDKDKRAREHDHDLGFAIPALDALWVAGQLRAHHRVDRAYLGVTMSDSVPSEGHEAEPESEGVVLSRVLEDTPASRSGLKSGDRLIALNDQPVRTPNDLTDRLDRTAADLDVTLDFIRGAGPSRERHRLTLRTASRPPVPEPAPVKLSSSPTPPPKPKPELPREVADRIERLERRIDELEKREAAAAAQTPQP